MPEVPPSTPSPVESRTVPRRKTRISLVWIVPIVAAIAGIWVGATIILGRGPTITIVFDTAEGLEAGKTQIHYNGVDVGTLTTIRLSDDHASVIATAQMEPKTDGFLVEGTKFWVVRPRISGATVTGLGTLISGAYVGMEIGTSKQAKRDFVALKTPPVISGDTPGRFFVLHAPNLGSLAPGTPVFFRRLEAGEVVSYELTPDGQALDIQVFVKAPYDQYVNGNTRFWQASGIDVSLTASGLTVQTQSLLSILIGGIAFETPASAPVLEPAEANAEFKLFENREAAFKLPARDPQTYALVFKDSLRGLSPGAPVEFRGIPVGEVVQIEAEVDARTMEFSAPVTIHLDAQRLGVKLLDLPPDVDFAVARRKLINHLVANGARAQLRSGNLLTGALYVAFDFFPDAPPATVDWSKEPIELPTIPGDLQVLEAKVMGIVEKIDKLPFAKIGSDLEKALAELDRTLVSTRRAVDNADKLIEPNSVLGAELGSTLQEVSRAARGVRILADYLERHPEALIRGKAGEAK